MTPYCVLQTGGLPDDPCWCGVCEEDDQGLVKVERYGLESDLQAARDGYNPNR